MFNVYRKKVNYSAVSRIVPLMLWVCFWHSLVFAQAPDGASFNSREGVGTIANKALARIVGGANAAGDYPWMLSFQSRDQSGTFQHLCGAVAISSNAAITAAHCVQRAINASALRVSWREDGLIPGAFDQSRTVLQVVQHPYFDPVSLSFDVAVIRWADPIEGLEPLALAVPGNINGGSGGQWTRLGAAELTDPAHSLSSYPGEQTLPGLYDVGLVLEQEAASFRILGWGVTDPEQLSVLSNTLQEAPVSIFSRGYCDSRSLSRAQTSICAGLADGSVDSCVGDSGGPLFRVDQDERYSLVGLVSYGAGCAIPDEPGFYTDIMQVIPFIYGVIQGRDHWVSLGWLGQGLLYQQRYTLYNFSAEVQRLATLTGSTPEGVIIEGNSCDFASLPNAKSCELIYQYQPQGQGRFLMRTPFEIETTQSNGLVVSRTAYLLGVGNSLPPLIPGEAFQGVGLSWHSGGDSAWVVDKNAYVGGGASLKTGPISDNQVSVLQAVFDGPKSLTAYVFVESEEDYDELTVRINGELIFVASGMTQWTTLVLNIPSQGAVVEFAYSKDGSVSTGRDAAWVDFQSLDESGRSFDEALGFVMQADLSSDQVNSSSGGGIGVIKIMVLIGLLFIRARRAFWQSAAKSLGRVLVFTCALGLVACSSAPTSDHGPQAPKPPILQSTELNAKANFKPSAEPLYSKQIKNGKLYIQVRSFGCTSASNFRLIESEERSGWYVVERKKPDLCRAAPRLVTVPLPIPFIIEQQLKNSTYGNKILLMNIHVPNTGIPEIPFD